MRAGDRFLDFYIEGFLGHGNFGDVYVAGNLREGRRVALKIVRKGVGEEEEAKFAAEVYGAKLQKALQDPGGHVVHVYSYGIDEESGAFFIEMEFVEGEDLATVIRDRAQPPEPSEVARIGSSLCGLLQWLAAAQIVIDDKPLTAIVHGDLKPRNVRIERNTGKVKVLDFGIARAMKETLVTMPWNSPAYTSPERLESGKADLQSDLWAVGVMLYELMMGHLPFQAESRELLERRIRSSDPPPPLPPNYPLALRRIIQRMLRRNPAERFPSPGAAQIAFDEFLGIGADGGMDETVRDTSARALDPDPTIRSSNPVSQAARRTLLPKGTTPNMRLALVGLLGFTLVGAGVSSYSTVSRSSQLATAIQRDQITDLDAAWKQYQELDKATWMPVLTVAARNAIRDKFLARAFEIIDEYRMTDAPAVYQRQWQQASTWLGRALELDGGNARARAALRLCEGHLARIQVSSKAARADASLRQRYTNTAIQRFNEAASLRNKWPDPYLGLAILYTYDAIDLNRAEEALKNAQEAGHRVGNRERAQIADGHRRMADRTFAESTKMRELPEQEMRLLEKAKQHCEVAAMVYQELGVYQHAVDNLKNLIVRCQIIQMRMEEMAGTQNTNSER